MTVVSTSTTTKKEKPGGGETVVVDTAERVYGIRSHLHEFYDWGAAFRGGGEGGGDGWYLIPQSSATNRRCLVYAFRALTILGLLLLVAGAVLILVGYMWPKESPATILSQLGQTEDGKIYIPDDVVSLLEDKMRTWKLAGLIIFASGGTILAISLLVPTCARLFGRESLTSDLSTPVEPSVKIFAATPPTLTASSPAKDGKRSISPPSSPTERRVPVVEEITAVQPKSKALDSARRPSGDELLLMEENEMKRH